MTHDVISYALGTAASEHRDDPAGLGMHTDNLHDENEGAGGRLFDEATGDRIDNSTYTGLEDLVVLSDQEVRTSLGGAGVTAAKRDAAEEWLKENDPDYKD